MCIQPWCSDLGKLHIFLKLSQIDYTLTKKKNAKMLDKTKKHKGKKSKTVIRIFCAVLEFLSSFKLVFHYALQIPAKPDLA